MQPQEYFSTPSSSSSSSSSDIQLSLEPLTICPKKNQTEKHCKSCMIASTVVFSSASSLIGDYIGMESCFDVDKTEEQLELFLSKSSVTSSDGDLISGVCSKIRHRCRRTKKREFPPPIPSLARTENLNSHMPWVLKRYYTSDGRLILREERVKHHEYFRAHRSNGRLTLHLVPLDDDYDDEINDLGPIKEDIEIEDDHHEIDQQEEEEERMGNNGTHQDSDFNSNIIANADDDNSNVVAEGIEDINKSGILIEESNSMVKCSSVAENPSIENGIAAAAAATGNFLNYSSVSVRASPTCFLGMPMPAIRPVHS
ncbi:hypothetical protein CCACVL1_10006 [Corchorus capsularis]|uniref:FAF domain-containing protein n=1 Tax=Corchorus capsularis TaxID=210143 RepID=A0A1R3IT67_COCAP|nr:hypothetical protein CCACVL1_10006 [Corchorus capsularis]